MIKNTDKLAPAKYSGTYTTTDNQVYILDQEGKLYLPTRYDPITPSLIGFFPNPSRHSNPDITRKILGHVLEAITTQDHDELVKLTLKYGTKPYPGTRILFGFPEKTETFLTQQMTSRNPALLVR
jgi:hypothetical protein